MKNTFINNYRRFIKMSTFVTKSDEISSPNLVFSSTKNQGEAKFVMDDINKALEKLPADYMCLSPLYFEGHKYTKLLIICISRSAP